MAEQDCARHSALCRTLRICGSAERKQVWQVQRARSSARAKRRNVAGGTSPSTVSQWSPTRLLTECVAPTATAFSCPWVDCRADAARCCACSPARSAAGWVATACRPVSWTRWAEFSPRRGRGRTAGAPGRRRGHRAPAAPYACPGRRCGPGPSPRCGRP